MTAKSKSDFIQYVVDMLSPLGAVETRAMFGGHNVSLGGLTFGLIVDDMLYLKADAENRPSFEELGLGPFVYGSKDGRPMTMSYFTAPDCLDDWDALGPYATGALAAARRAKAAKPAAKKAPRKSATPAAKKTSKKATPKAAKRR